MSPERARALRMGDMVTLSDYKFTTVRLWSVPGVIQGDVDSVDYVSRVESEIVGEVYVGSLGMVLGIVEVPLRQQVRDEPVELLVLSGDCLGWVIAGNVEEVQ